MPVVSLLVKALNGMKESHSICGRRSLKSYVFGSTAFKVTTDVDILKWSLYIIAVLTRFWRLDHPRAVVFDEMFYGRFASFYLKNIFYFDTHPPLGKMLIALVGYLANFNGEVKFDRIGLEYPVTVPVGYLRSVSAISGSLLVPVTYQIVTELGYKPWTAGLAGCLIILDNALLTESRFMLIEMPLLLFISLAMLCYTKFRHHHQRPYTLQWWLWLTSLGICFGVIVSIKYFGIFSVLLLLVLIGKDFWNLLPCSTLTNMQLSLQLMARVLCLIILPITLYISVFYLHLSILYKSGPHDDIMTSNFQASLQGGLSSVTRHQPAIVAYGSQITLRQTYISHPCWLHSHRAVYPIRYSANRGSSHQQQVTCYSYKDTNNWWIIKNPNRNTLTVDDPVTPVKHGDIIQLIHGLTGRALNSHDVAAPMSPQYQEVSCYIDYNISFPAQNLWRVELVNLGSDQIWHTLESHVRLVHVNTSTALKLSGKQLPEWGFHQLEVVADKNKEQTSSVWNVEEHRYTRLNDDENMEKDLARANVSMDKLTQMTFWAKFVELQYKMLSAKEPEIDHRYSSEPLSWPLTEKNIAYWYNPYNHCQIHLVGNLSLWISVAVCLLVYTGLLFFYILRRHRKRYDIEEDEWSRFQQASYLLLAGYVVNYLPYFMTDQTLFLYHYLPALYHSIVLTAILTEHIHQLMSDMDYIQPVYEMLLLIWLTCLFMTHVKLSVFSYGMTPLSRDDLIRLTWTYSWDFLHGAT